MGFLNARRRESCMTGTMDEGKHQLFQVRSIAFHPYFPP